MAAYLIAFAKVKTANRIPEYSSAAGPTLGASGGSVVTRGKVRSLVGGFSADSCLIVKFKDAAAIEASVRDSAGRWPIARFPPATALPDYQPLPFEPPREEPPCRT